MGIAPMPEHVEHKEIAGELANMERVLAVAERWLRPADHLDYVVRRWLIPIPYQDRVRLMPHKEASIRSSGVLSDVQVTIGRHLRAQYALERSMPARLANLLREFEQRNGQLEANDQTAVLAGA
jgi:hypothetical protein